MKKKNKVYEKIPIYWDVDDVVLDSAEAAIQIINKKYNIPNGLPEKEFKDLKDWNMRSIYKRLTPEMLEEIWETEEFWSSNRVRPDFLDLCSSRILDNYQNFFVTKGSRMALDCKKNFLDLYLGEYWKNFEYIGIPLEVSKNNYSMSKGIHIDDNLDNLVETNAKLKFLLTNGITTEYNDLFRYKQYDTSNIYVLNSLKDIKGALKPEIMDILIK